MSSPPLLIVKTGTTLPAIREQRGDFDDWIAARLGWLSERIRVVEVYPDERDSEKVAERDSEKVAERDSGKVASANVADGVGAVGDVRDRMPDALPDPESVAGIVVTGSGAMVSHREPWSEATAAWLGAAVRSETPCLGICYGHQLIAHALGGRVGPTPGGREMGTLPVRLEPAALADDPLLARLPASAPLHVTHVESVLELPSDAVRLAATALDANHAFRIGPRTWGIQFHPEFDADVMRRYIEGRRGILEDEGFDPDALHATVRETPHGDEILARFGRLVASL